MLLGEHGLIWERFLFDVVIVAGVMFLTPHPKGRDVLVMLCLHHVHAEVLEKITKKN